MKNISFLTLLMALFVAFVSVAAPAAEGRLSDDPDSRLSTIPHNEELAEAIEESRLGRIVVTHDGWRETLTSFARIALYDITGRTSIRGQSPVYTVLSIIYNPASWQDARILPVEHPKLAQQLEAPGKWVSPRFIVENPNIQEILESVREVQPLRQELERTTKLLNAVEQARELGAQDRVLSMFNPDGISPDQIRELMNNPEAWQATYDRRQELLDKIDGQKPFVKAAQKLLTRLSAFRSVGEELLIVPDPHAVDGSWIRPVAAGQSTNGGEPAPLLAAGRQLEERLRNAFQNGEASGLDGAASEFLSLANQSRRYTEPTYRTIQNLYVTKNPWNVAAWIYLVAGFVFGLFFFFQKPWMRWSGFGLLAFGFLFHSAALGVRLYLKGHIPVSNIYESLTFTSWALMALALGFELWSRKGLVGVGSAALGFLLLMAAGLMPLHETRIQPLRAVLDSYWLNIHVTMMLISYAAFAISAFFAGLYLVKSAFGREALFGGQPIMTLPQTEEFAYRLVQFGWPVLTFGVALGAVWADTAWGRFWGWDPKETWAFITWVGYTVYLHTRMVMGWRGRWSAAACLIGFVLVLITWLGVSYVPMFSGGLHSYASPNDF